LKTFYSYVLSRCRQCRDPLSMWLISHHSSSWQDTKW